VGLAGYTTLGLGGPAARFIEADSDDQVVAAVRAADQAGEPVLLLGGGSNLVIADDGFPGAVIRIATRGIRPAADEDGVVLTVAAGEEWDALVEWCVGEGLSGVECLAGIPGLTGATPIQNVGAYGQEVAESIVAVRVYDRRRGTVTELASADCGFGYRTSAFKRARAGRFVVLGVSFRLARDPLSAPVRYRELASALGIADGGTVPLADARAAVLRLRRRKGMVLDASDPDTRSAGSFFTNPVLNQAQLAALQRAAAAACGPGIRIPCYPAAGGRVKIPAAWLIEHAGFSKGYPAEGFPPGRNPAAGRPAPAAAPGQALPGPRISAKHTLALVNPGGATTATLLGLAREIRNGVRATFGVELVNEPVLVGAAL
jgi:UDP-N-acetylmuramate dehydrogenase